MWPSLSLHFAKNIGFQFLISKDTEFILYTKGQFYTEEMNMQKWWINTPLLQIKYPNDRRSIVIFA